MRRRLPPSVARKMSAHFDFQHRKQSSGTEAVFLQLPLSLRLRVASARYYRQIEHAWIFHGCNAQFLGQLVMVRSSRPPPCSLFRPDPAAELTREPAPSAAHTLGLLRCSRSGT